MRSPLARKNKWDPSFYVRIYELAKQGLTRKKIARSLGVESLTLDSWRREDPAVQYALDRGKEMRSGPLDKQTPTTSFIDYVYKRLPEELQDLYSALCPEQEEIPLKRVEMLLKGRGTRQMQTLFVHALVASNFNASEACRKLNLSYSTVGTWKDTDPAFIELMDHVHEMKKDFCEGALMGLVAQGDTSAVLFVNRTLNRDRGYDSKITVEHKGNVKHSIDITDLDLPPEVLRIILEASRKKKESDGQKRIEVKALPVHDEEEFLDE